MNMNHFFYARYVKRMVDIVMSFMGILFLAWLFLVLWILIRVQHGKPVIYKQQRPGYHEQIFCLYKFRTMTDEKDSDGNLLPDEQRLTKLGKILRATSLDELPQLWNIIKGDMSIIGPRPLLVSYLERYTEEQHRRHNVRPGLFGLAGVNGRNAQSWESKFQYDLYYVDHISFRLDVQIFFKCIKIVLKREGINEAGNSTASEFMGKNDEKIF